jgi:hypothetical protein
VTVLHRGSRYVVRFLRCSTVPFAIVCFEYLMPSPSLEGEFTAERFLRHRGLNAIGVLAAENDWFQHDEIEAVVTAIREAVPGYELIGYGGSMGAYACINFADRLGLQRVIAVCPQYSIDPSRAPWETRWRQEVAGIHASGGFRHDRIDKVSPPVEGWLVYDPGSLDAQHAQAILNHHRLKIVPVRFGQHQEMRMLQQADLFTPMLLDMIANRFDSQAFGRKLRVQRRNSAVFWIALSTALLRHRRPEAALRAIGQACLLPHPEPGEISVHRAQAEAACGHTQAALRLVEPWETDPGWGWAAGPLAEQLRTEMASAGPAPSETVEAAKVARPHKPLRRLLRYLLAWRPFA